MTTTFHLNESELTMELLAALKALFKNKNITLVVEAEEVDTTEYLLSNPTNRDRLLEAVKNINAEKKLTEINMNELKALVNA